MRMNKKGALELSINAIVILILAITMLGLGLGFMKKTFGGVTAQFGEVSDQMKKEMIDRMKDSTKKVDLNVYEIEMKRSEEKSIFIAIKNDLQTDTAFDICTEDSCDSSASISTSTGCTAIGLTPPDCGVITVTTFLVKSVKSGEIEVLPIKVKVQSDATPTTYMMPIVVKAQAVAGTTAVEEVVNLFITVR